MTRISSSTRRLGFACALCAALLALSSSAAAQVAVLRIDPAAEALCRTLESALGSIPHVADPGYLAEAQNQGLDPASDRSLTLLVPLLGIRLALVPQSADARSTLIEFRDGRSGANLGTATIPLENLAVGWQGQRLLQMEVQRRLQGAPPPGSAPAFQGPPIEGGPAAADDQAEGETAADEDELYLRVFAGAGMGMRQIAWPAAGQTLSVETGPFLAVELGASFGVRLSPSVELGPELVYQTSLDHEINEAHIDGATEKLGIRAHRFEALLALSFGSGDDGWRIAPELGYAMRNLRPEVHHLQTPGYTLAGPMLRVRVRIPFGDSVALVLAPEVQYVIVGDAFEDLGAESTGLAFGGQASFEIALSHEYAIELMFREAHALIASALGDDASDIERFATARFRWQP